MLRALAWLLVGTALVGCENEPAAVPLMNGGGGWSSPRPRPRVAIDKVDLLIVVDDSRGMAAHQAELARRVPELVARLTDRTPDPRTGMSYGFIDLRVGVITTSLGAFGTSACGAGDAARLRGGVMSWVHTRDRDPSARFTGEGGVTELASALSSTITALGESGCGYQATWESMYHFLIDPAPYARAEVKCTVTADGDACGSNKIVVEGLDEELLQQRKQFLRPDSMLAVVVLSDENDASLKPAGLNWLPWAYRQGEMKRGWASCANAPDDFEPETAADFNRLHTEHRCFSCFEDPSDANCALPWSAPDVDHRELRAFEQTRRFGYNFLWGRQRYIDAFTRPLVLGSDGKLASNPVFAGGFRTQELIVVAPIVGAPVATPHAPSEAEWAKLVGPAREPSMIETLAPEGDRLLPACTVTRDGEARHATPGLRHLRIAQSLGVSAHVTSICESSFGESLRQLADGMRDRVRAATDCLRTSLAPDPSGRVNCVLVEVMRDGVDGGSRCEDVARGLCTPGAAPCRKAGSDYPPITVAEAAAQLNVPIDVEQEDGTTRSVMTQAEVIAGNVYAVGSDGRRHLLCETYQLEGAALQSCIADATFTAADGYCYSQQPEVVGPLCQKVGAPGTLRFLGSATPRSGSTVHVYCTAG